MIYYKTFGFIEKVFILALTFFVCNVINVNSWRCVSMNNQECTARSEIIIINYFVVTVLK